MKRQLSKIVALTIIFLFTLSACTNKASPANPSVTLPDTPSTSVPTIPVASESPTISEFPIADNSWQIQTVLDENSNFVNGNSGEGFSGREIVGSKVTIDRDTFWNIALKVDKQSMSTGIIIEGIESNNSRPHIYLGYSEGGWSLGYALHEEYTFFQTLFVGNNPEMRFQLKISSGGKLLELHYGSKKIFSKLLDYPFFSIDTVVTAYTQFGPHSAIKVSSLSIGQKEGTDVYEYVARPNPETEFYRFQNITNSSSDLILNIAYSPDGTTFASGVNGVTLWDAVLGTKIVTFDDFHSSVRSVAYSPDGKILAAGSWDFTVGLWDIASGEKLQTLVRHTGPVLNVAFSPDGKFLASGSYDMLIYLWDVSTGTKVRTLVGHTMDVNSIAFSSDGLYIASGSTDKTLILWDAVSQTKIRTLIGHAGSIFGVAFSPDGKTLASGSWDGTIILWDVPTGNKIATFDTGTDKVWSVAYSPDGKTLASGSMDGTIIIWDIESGKMEQTLWNGDSLTSIAFSPDGQTLISDSHNTITIWKKKVK